MDLDKIISITKAAAREAGEEILKIYHSGDFSIESKSDNSPLTKADKASHNTIVRKLEEFDLPILSEEGASIPFETRKSWPYFWMIDPLDGTKEFIKKNGEFTVNIALIKGDRPVFGVVYVPVFEDMYYGLKGHGAYKNDTQIKAVNFDFQSKNLKIVASRSHLNEDTEEFLKKFDEPEIVSKGSSLKLLLVAEGKAHLYPRYAPTMEWDTAAAQIIVEEAGGKVLQKTSNQPVVYNKENLLNPHFLVQGVN